MKSTDLTSRIVAYIKESGSYILPKTNEEIMRFNGMIHNGDSLLSKPLDLGVIQNELLALQRDDIVAYLKRCREIAARLKINIRTAPDLSSDIKTETLQKFSEVLESIDSSNGNGIDNIVTTVSNIKKLSKINQDYKESLGREKAIMTECAVDYIEEFNRSVCGYTCEEFMDFLSLNGSLLLVGREFTGKTLILTKLVDALVNGDANRYCYIDIQRPVGLNRLKGKFNSSKPVGKRYTDGLMSDMCNIAELNPSSEYYLVLDNLTKSARSKSDEKVNKLGLPSNLTLIATSRTGVTPVHIPKIVLNQKLGVHYNRLVVTFGLPLTTLSVVMHIADIVEKINDIVHKNKELNSFEDKIILPSYIYNPSLSAEEVTSLLKYVLKEAKALIKIQPEFDSKLARLIIQLEEL